MGNTHERFDAKTDILQPRAPSCFWGCIRACARKWSKPGSSERLVKRSIVILSPQASEEALFDASHYITSGINHQWQADLVDMQAYARDNDGFKHILTVIDMFSRRGWAEAVKSKTTPDMMGAFTKIFDTGDKPIKLYTDQGLELEGRAMQRFFHDNAIEH